MRAYFILAVGALSVMAAVFGYRAGSNELTETAAIQAVADVWVAQGGAPTDCFAVPGDISWLIVRCAGDTRAQTWKIDANGRIAAVKDGA